MVDDAPPATSDTDPTRASAPHDAFSYSYATAEATHAPHIVYILADDLGWNDVGYQSSDLDGFSPTLDHLANGGVRLTSFYALHQCTPARSALEMVGALRRAGVSWFEIAQHRAIREGLTVGTE